MRWSKLDARLQDRLGDDTTDGTDLLSVFIRADDGGPGNELTDLGAEEVAAHLYVADLDRDVIDALSEEPWVDEIRLSGIVQPLNNGSHGPTTTSARAARPRPTVVAEEDPTA